MKWILLIFLMMNAYAQKPYVSVFSDANGSDVHRLYVTPCSVKANSLPCSGIELVSRELDSSNEGLTQINFLGPNGMPIARFQGIMTSKGIMARADGIGPNGENLLMLDASCIYKPATLIVCGYKPANSTLPISFFAIRLAQ